MDILGILSLIFGSIGTILSYWYIGIIPCVVGTVLGIVGLTDCFSDRKFSLFGLLISVFGIILTAYIVVSDVDSDRLLVQADKFGQEEQSVIAEPAKPVEAAETKNIAENRTETESEAEEKREDSSKLSLGQENAIRSAKTYLEFMPFSYQGLVRQLEFDKYTEEDAVFAADNCEADWNEQAVRSAKSYLEYSSFSKEGLIEQLEFEGFTHEQAVYGVEQNGY